MLLPHVYGENDFLQQRHYEALSMTALPGGSLETPRILAHPAPTDGRTHSVLILTPSNTCH